MISLLQDRPSSILGTPGRKITSVQSPATNMWWLDDDHEPFTPHRTNINFNNQRPLVHGARNLSGFSTPQRVTMMGREHQWAEFRTPQHTASGTNNWGGDSPLLRANFPRKSLDLNYLRFNPLDDGGDLGTVLGTPMNDGGGDDLQIRKKERDGDVKRRVEWVLKKLGWRKKEKKVVVMRGEKEKRIHRIFRRSKRWPQGW